MCIRDSTSTTVYSGTSETVTSDSAWNPSGDEGTYTIVYAFTLIDQDSSDEMLAFNMNLTRSYVDLEVNEAYNPLDDLEGVATYNGAIVLNSNTDYDLNAKGTISACGTCNFEATLGWQLWNLDEPPVLMGEAYTVAVSYTHLTLPTILLV